MQRREYDLALQFLDPFVAQSKSFRTPRQGQRTGEHFSIACWTNTGVRPFGTSWRDQLRSYSKPSASQGMDNARGGVSTHTCSAESPA
ncbi:hypothetical protein NDU88_002527 [Pleurodeles waltl]|uniref:Uncharacterized protein n=1 Tax=Pleurodeles waltl TaxID=8319 RepID=A0AAV7P8I5_PLEWA|nr:hypothetical protein NDU88_002527 [Pleurodeles waltl]